MANGGWYGTQEEWSRVEAPLKLLDPEIQRFANKYGLIPTRNLKSWPERSFAWGTDVRCLLQVYLADQAELGVNIWICASQDRGGNRYWKREHLICDAMASSVQENVFEILERGKRQLDLWSAKTDDFERCC